MPKRSKRNHVATMNEGSYRGWLRRFETEVRKLNSGLALAINWTTAHAYFESSKYTPANAAVAYVAYELKKTQDGQSSRHTKG